MKFVGIVTIFDGKNHCNRLGKRGEHDYNNQFKKEVSSKVECREIQGHLICAMEIDK